MAWETNAEQGQCEYCGDHGLVMVDPFGNKPACKTCWELICFGDEDEDNG